MKNLNNFMVTDSFFISSINSWNLLKVLMFRIQLISKMYFFNYGRHQNREYLSSFSYKNHWSAYVIMIISMTFTLIFSIIKKSNLLVLK